MAIVTRTAALLALYALLLIQQLAAQEIGCGLGTSFVIGDNNLVENWGNAPIGMRPAALHVSGGACFSCILKLDSTVQCYWVGDCAIPNPPGQFLSFDCGWVECCGVTVGARSVVCWTVTGNVPPAVIPATQNVRQVACGTALLLCHFALMPSPCVQRWPSAACCGTAAP